MEPNQVSLDCEGEIGDFNILSLLIRINQKYPNSKNIHPFLFNDEIGLTVVHEILHFIQTTTTLSGLRLFNYEWESLINILASDEECKNLINSGKKYHSKNEEKRDYAAKTNYFRLYGIKFKPNTESSENVEFAEGNSKIYIKLNIENLSHPYRRTIKISVPFISIGFYEFELKALLGAVHIREGAAKVIEHLFAKKYFPNSPYANSKNFEDASYLPENIEYFAALHLFYSTLKHAHFRTLLSFLVVSEIALLLDHIIGSFPKSIIENYQLNDKLNKEGNIKFWENDYGAGIYFIKLIDFLNKTDSQLSPILTYENALSLFKYITDSFCPHFYNDHLPNAINFIKSDFFYFQDKEWGTFFESARETFLHGLSFRNKHKHSPVFLLMISDNTDDIIKLFNFPFLIAFNDKCFGRESSPNQLLLPILKHAFVSIIKTGKTECLLYNQPHLCKKANNCTLGFPQKIKKVEYDYKMWCPYVKCLIPLLSWTKNLNIDNIDNHE